MRISIGRSKIGGSLDAPPSKSYTIRGLMCAALAKGTSELVCPLEAEDTNAACRVLRETGVDIHEGGRVWQVSGGRLRPPVADLDCGESAATLRFMTAIAASIPGETRLTAKPSLARRPMETLVEALYQLGIECHQDMASGCVTVRGGEFKAATVSLPGNISSQYVTALLLVGPLSQKGLLIHLTTPLESKPYAEMTIECLKKFGITVSASEGFDEFKVEPQEYTPAQYNVEGDWSSASYFLALGAMAGEVEIENLNPQSLQGDRVLLDFLKQMGATVSMDGDSVRIRRGSLTAINADLTDCIDILPTLAVVASTADGTSELTGIARARIKESDRVSSVRLELQKAGVETSEETNKLSIVGRKPNGAIFDSHEDHRIAMAMSLLGIVAGDTVIDGAECVSKTYPDYWRALASVGGKVDINVE